MKKSDDDRFLPLTSVQAGELTEVLPDLAYYTNQIVNIAFIGTSNNWVLVDAGLKAGAKKIIGAAEKLYGENAKPKGIILTHGHSDHVGSLIDLIEFWNVPVYAHALEFPYLTGQQDYPEPDTSVQGGLMAKMSSIIPHHGIDIHEVLRPLPEDGSVPFLPDWKWIHTPGHTPGHVSFVRMKDRALVSGDALITVRQDKLLDTMLQHKELTGPPRYLTTDWTAAKNSVSKLTGLSPNILVPGHGYYMQGEELSSGLQYLNAHFDEVALPTHGRFVNADDQSS